METRRRITNEFLALLRETVAPARAIIVSIEDAPPSPEEIACQLELDRLDGIIRLALDSLPQAQSSVYEFSRLLDTCHCSREEIEDARQLLLNLLSEGN